MLPPSPGQGNITFGIRVFDVRIVGITLGVIASKWVQVEDLKRGIINGVEINRNMRKESECRGLNVVAVKLMTK